MNISFLVPDINSPVLGPVISLARMLEDEHAVEIIGPDFGHGVCPMYRDAYPFTVVETPRMYRYPEYLWESRRLGKVLNGDLIIAVKAYASTVGVALREKRRRGVRAMVYLDEWDGALMAMKTPRERLATWRRQWAHPLDQAYHPLVERRIPRMDGVISTNRSLQKKFGGDIVHVGVDTDYFRPAPAARVAQLRAEHDLTECTCIVFGGVVRPHKGIELILDALVQIANPTLRFVIVGPINEHVRSLQERPDYRPYLAALGAQPKAQMPTYLSMADLMILPLNDNLLAQSQTPCKIFEAMAMAKPIIASAVSDLPEILAGCGMVVPPGDPVALAAAIQSLLDDPKRAQALGESAREKCIREYSQPVMRQALLRAVERVMR